MRDYLECKPFLDLIAILQHHHVSIHAEMDAVMARVDAAHPGVEGVVSNSFAHLIRQIAEHEQAEDQVLARAFGSDQGNHDGPPVR